MLNPGMDSSLSSVPPVWPKPAAADHRHRQSAGRHDRRKNQRSLVADAAGRMFVHFFPGKSRKIEHFAGMQHRLGQRADFSARSARESTTAISHAAI